MDRGDIATAIVLIVAEPGAESDVYQQLKLIPEVVEAMLLFGEYDLYAKLGCSAVWSSLRFGPSREWIRPRH